MLAEVLNHPTLLEKPPVLLDVGASGQLHTRWKRLAKYAICIAFDGDTRDFAYSTTENKGYLKLHLYHALLAGKVQEKATFYLTASPHCSSLLPPDAEGLKFMAWADRFRVVEEVQMPTTDLPTALASLQLTYIDWFKTDSQGIDLQLFKSLPATVRENVLVTEMEPGIINGYQGEDKLHEVLAYMHQQGHFWLADLQIKGSARIAKSTLESATKRSFWQKLLMFSLPNSADWGEMLYLHTLENQTPPTLRSLLLAWLFAMELKQTGWAIHLAKRGQASFPDEPLFAKMTRYATSKLWGNIWRLRFLPALRTKLRKMMGG